MSGLEEDLIGESLDYEEYDLDDEEEQALLAEEQETEEVIIHEHLPNHEIKFHEEVDYPSQDMEEYVEYQGDEIESQEQEISAIEVEQNYAEEEEEEEDDCSEETSRGRDRFKSERTKLSLVPDVQNKRIIPDSLDEVIKSSNISKQQYGSKRGQSGLRGRGRANSRDMMNRGGIVRPIVNGPWEMQQARFMQPVFRGVTMRMPEPFLPLAPQITPLMQLGGGGARFQFQNVTGPWSQGFLQNSLYQDFSKDVNGDEFQNRNQNTNQFPQITPRNNVQSNKVTNKGKEGNKNPLPVHMRLSRPSNSNANTSQDTNNNSNRNQKITEKNGNKVKLSEVASPKPLTEEEEYQKKLKEQKLQREKILANKEMRRKEAALKADNLSPNKPEVLVPSQSPAKGKGPQANNNQSQKQPEQGVCYNNVFQHKKPQQIPVLLQQKRINSSEQSNKFFMARPRLITDSRLRTPRPQIPGGVFRHPLPLTRQETPRMATPLRGGLHTNLRPPNLRPALHSQPNRMYRSPHLIRPILSSPTMNRTAFEPQLRPIDHQNSVFPPNFSSPPPFLNSPPPVRRSPLSVARPPPSITRPPFTVLRHPASMARPPPSISRPPPPMSRPPPTVAGFQSSVPVPRGPPFSQSPARFPQNPLVRNVMPDPYHPPNYYADSSEPRPHYEGHHPLPSGQYHESTQQWDEPYLEQPSYEPKYDGQYSSYDEESSFSPQSHSLNDYPPMTSQSIPLDRQLQSVQNARQDLRMKLGKRVQPINRESRNVMAPAAPEPAPTERIVTGQKVQRRFKKIIRRNKGGEVISIKKILLDVSGNAVGPERYEYVNEGLISANNVSKNSGNFKKIPPAPLSFIGAPKNLAKKRMRTVVSEPTDPDFFDESTRPKVIRRIQSANPNETNFRNSNFTRVNTRINRNVITQNQPQYESYDLMVGQEVPRPAGNQSVRQVISTHPRDASNMGLIGERRQLKFSQSPSKGYGQDMYAQMPHQKTMSYEEDYGDRSSVLSQYQ